MCTSCIGAFHLVEETKEDLPISHCDANICSCMHGTVAFGDACIAHNSTTCSACHWGYDSYEFEVEGLPTSDCILMGANSPNQVKGKMTVRAKLVGTAIQHVSVSALTRALQDEAALWGTTGDGGALPARTNDVPLAQGGMQGSVITVTVSQECEVEVPYDAELVALDQLAAAAEQVYCQGNGGPACTVVYEGVVAQDRRMAASTAAGFIATRVLPPGTPDISAPPTQFTRAALCSAAGVPDAAVAPIATPTVTGLEVVASQELVMGGVAQGEDVNSIRLAMEAAAQNATSDALRGVLGGAPVQMSSVLTYVPPRNDAPAATVGAPIYLRPTFLGAAVAAVLVTALLAKLVARRRRATRRLLSGGQDAQGARGANALGILDSGFIEENPLSKTPAPGNAPPSTPSKATLLQSEMVSSSQHDFV